jgi:hypothetical protein
MEDVMNELIEVNGGDTVAVPALGDETLVQLAEQAEKRVDAINKIKRAALKATNPGDWTDQGGKPYLWSSGAEKIARVFGVSWKISEPKFVQEESGHFSYSYTGTFSLAGATIEVIGSRSSKDGFFKRYVGSGADRKELPPSEIDKGDVMKAAYTNLIGGGICRLLGIRNLSYEDLKEFAGIMPGMIPRVDYKKAGKTDTGIKSENALTVTIGIADIRKQTGETKGKPWTKFVIKGSDGNEYGTFSETTATTAKDAQGAGLQIEVTYVSGKFGNDIESIKKIEPEAGKE